MKVLITGSNGFIGTNLVGFLHQVLSINKLTLVDRGLRMYNIASPRYQLMDCGDVESLPSLGQHDIVIHLAGETRVEDSFHNPVPFFDNNVATTGKLLYSAHRMGVKKFIFFSTCGALFDTSDRVAEDSQPNPSSIYGATKLACEDLVHAAGKVYGMETCCVRPTNIFGPFSSHKKSIVADWCKRLIAGEQLEITGDGEQTRDFVPVQRVVSTVAGLLPMNQIIPKILHICSGTSITINELCDKFDAAANALDIPFTGCTYVNKRKEVRNVRASSIFRQPEKEEDIYDFLTDTIEWFKDNA